MKQGLIRLTHVLPPIPIRTMDWCAYWDGEEESQRVGWGSTRIEALQELLDIEEDDG